MKLNIEVSLMTQMTHATTSSRRNDGSSPVHKSACNRKDSEDVINTRIKPADGSAARTHHMYRDGTETIKKGGLREQSTSASSPQQGTWWDASVLYACNMIGMVEFWVDAAKRLLRR